MCVMVNSLLMWWRIVEDSARALLTKFLLSQVHLEECFAHKEHHTTLGRRDSQLDLATHTQTHY